MAPLRLTDRAYHLLTHPQRRRGDSVRLTEHFTTEELCGGATAARLANLGINIQPGPAELENLLRLATELEKVRALFGGRALKIHSGYRSPAVNVAVGGSTNEAVWLAALKQLNCSEADALKLYGISKPVKWRGASYHTFGLAADFDPPGAMTHDAAQHLIGADEGVDYDLILEEGTAKPESEGGSRWIHCQIPLPGQPARRLLRDAEVDKLGGKITRTAAG